MCLWDTCYPRASTHSSGLSGSAVQSSSKHSMMIDPTEGISFQRWQKQHVIQETSQ